MIVEIPEEVKRTARALNKEGGFLDFIERYLLTYYYQQFISGTTLEERERVHQLTNVVGDAIAAIKNIAADAQKEIEDEDK